MFFIIVFQNHIYLPFFIKKSCLFLEKYRLLNDGKDIYLKNPRPCAW